MFSLKKINNVEIEPLKIKPINLDKIKGRDLFPKLYGNIFLCAHQRSGKSTVIYNIIRDCTDKNTQLYIFCSNHNTDEAYQEIKKLIEKKGLFVEFYTSLIDIDSKINELELIMKDIQETIPEEEEKDLTDTQYNEIEHCYEHIKIKIKKSPKDKKQAPKNIFIFDDFSHELKNKWLIKLLKEPTHYRSKVIISTQYLHDLEPGSRDQINFWLIFKDQPRDKLDIIHKHSSLKMPIEVFYKIYDDVTLEKYNFLYIEKAGELRKNFNTVILI